MIKHSEAYSKAINENALVPRSKIVVDGVEYFSNILKTQPKISHKACSVAGNFPSKTVNFEIYDLDNIINLENKEIIVYKGLSINGEVEYLQQGIFIPQKENIEVNISQRFIKIKDARDKSQNLENVYESSLDWSVKHTGLEIINEICEKRNIKLASSSFPFADFLFDKPNFKSGITEAEVIWRLAEIGGAEVLFNYLGELEIKVQLETGIIKERKSYSSISEGSEVVYNQVVLGKEGINDDIEFPKDIENPVPYKIEDNPYVDLNREEMIEEVASYIIGLSYIPYKIESFIDGNIFELNDVFTIKDRNDKEVRIVVNNIENATRISSTFSFDEESKKNVEHSIAGSNKKSINEVRFDVDHLKNEIDVAVKNVNEAVESTKEMQTEMNIRADSIESSVSDIQQNVDSNNEEITNLKQQVTNVQTSTSQQFTIIEEKIENGVETLKNALVTIDINGIHVSMNESKISMLITNNQFAIVNDQGVNLAFFGYNEEENRSISEMDNLTVTNFFTAGAHRQEKFVDPDTGEVRTGWAYTEVDA